MLSLALAGLIILNSKNPAAACNSSSVSFWWTAEDTDITVAGSYTSCASGCNGTATNVEFNIDASKLGSGTLGMQGVPLADPDGPGGPLLGCPGGTACNKNTAFTIHNDDIVNDCSGTVGFWFQYDGTDPDGAGATLDSAWPGTAGARLWRIQDSANDRLDIRTLGTNLGGSEGNLSITYRGADGVNVPVSTGQRFLFPDTWYYIRASWKCDNPGTTDYIKLFIYDSTGTLKCPTSNPSCTATAQNTALNLSPWSTTAGLTYTMYVGDDPGTVASQRWQGPFYIDQVLVSSNPDKDLIQCSTTANYPGGAR